MREPEVWVKFAAAALGVRGNGTALATIYADQMMERFKERFVWNGEKYVRRCDPAITTEAR